MTKHWRPQWARSDVAQEALDEAQERLVRVEQQGREVSRIARILMVMGQRNHFQDSIKDMFGVHR